MSKISFFDRKIIKKFSEWTSGISTAASLALIFIDIPKEDKYTLGLIFVLGLGLLYVYIWWWLGNLRNIDIDIESSTVTIKEGDLFSEDGFKVISFNEYFDTKVDEKIISSKSLNGEFLKKHLSCSINELDQRISNYRFEESELKGENLTRVDGKRKRYTPGTIYVHDDFLLTAFAKFDEQNRAWLTMPDYLEFLLNFWDKVNKIYAQKSVSVPIFGSGITRIKEHKNISDEELLKIMLWTFRISEMRFKYPAKLTVIIHSGKIDRINLLDIKSARNGL
ncbi:DUF6430 domain-containing protein [Pantoea sp. B566]|uniref:macro domain-containing protein n=1 Tax=Pantoea sp. B566 TaxID=2974030 RepID=UPI0021665C0F|nr:macro domain-containing protein [Pantoea sp. B566]MCS3405412.1 DUF6430 domain-containing protein [Pantoea sp. B566]